MIVVRERGYDVDLYKPGQDGDVELLHWYGQLVNCGDLQKLVGPSLYPLAPFMRHFIDPSVDLFYLSDENGWWIVGWTFPLMGGGTWGLWVRPESRRPGRARTAMTFIMDSLDLATQRFPVVVNTTKQPPVVAKTQRLGYTYLGVVPLLFEGEDCHVLHLTRAAFEPILTEWRNHNGRIGHGTRHGQGRDSAGVRDDR